jgi:hypothetical protein
MKEKKKHANRDIAEVQTSILASIVLSIFNPCHVKVDILRSLQSTFPTFQNISISLPGYNNKTKLQYLMKVAALNIKNMKTISPCGDIWNPSQVVVVTLHSSVLTTRAEAKYQTASSTTPNERKH